MPRANKYPNLKKRFTRGTWEIYWFWNYRRYTYNPGFNRTEDGDTVESELRLLSAVLASEAPELGERWKAHDGIVRYLRDRLGQEQAIEPEAESIAPKFWIEDYKPDLYNGCSKMWANPSMKTIKELDAFVPGGIGKTTSLQASRFLEFILAKDKGNTPATRNRKLTACKRFFGWCVRTGRTTTNPFANIKAMREIKPEEIVYCTEAEMWRAIAAARGTGRPDWIAVAIALHAGCRREEIFRLQWPDVYIDKRRLHIKVGKTGKRLSPFPKDLEIILVEAQKERGYVVPRVPGETWQNQADRLVELVRECLSQPENPNLAGRAREAVGKRKFLMTEESIAAQPKRIKEEITAFGKFAKKGKDYLRRAIVLAGLMGCPEKAHDGDEWIPAERLGWNAWRHTFATLRVQRGKSLDKVSAWLGNSYEVCRQHYAQFMPRDASEEDVEI